LAQRPKWWPTLHERSASEGDIQEFRFVGRGSGGSEEREADIIFGIYKNDERMKWLDYVEPAFMMDPVSVVVRRARDLPTPNGTI